jgi:hypothetical protein
MLTMQHTPAVSAIHPAKALLCVGRILYCASMRALGAVAHLAQEMGTNTAIKTRRRPTMPVAWPHTEIVGVLLL